MNLKDIKQDQVFYECQYGMNARCVALEDARRVIEPDKGRDGWALNVRIAIGKHPETEVEYFEAENPGAYGLRLYAQPQYSE